MGNFRRFIFIAGILIVAFGIFVVWRAFFAKPAQPANVVALSGRIEGDDSAVAGKTSGRLIEVRFREGDQVRAGDVIATLDDSQVRAREEQAQAGVLQAEARLRSAHQQIAIFNEQLRQNNLEKRQSEADSDGRVRQAEAELAAAEAQLAQQKSSYQLAAFDRDAYSKLVTTGAVSERQGRQAKTTADAQEASVAAAQRRVDAARGALTTARSSLRNPDIRSAQVAMIRQQIAQQESEIASAAADE